MGRTMSNGISPIPPVPQSIKDAINKEKLAVFIGAGVSRLVGCLGWGDLARNLIKRCYRQKIINFKERETLFQIQDHKKTITICYHLFHNKHLADLFYEEMSTALKEGNFDDAPPLYKDIYKLRGLFITTNADTHLDHLFHGPNILFRLEDFDANRIDKTNLYHIHGSIGDRKSLVFTVSEYISRYSFLPFQRFLEGIFRDYTVLFLGYGVSEFEILDFILRSNPRDSRSEARREEPRHYILSPFYSGEENILEYERTYYRDLDINVLAYEKDVRGYEQLIDVLSAWNNEINEVTGYQYAAFREIEKALE